ncbi:MAG: tRNA pseudouridine(38-40) synthase TruA [Clostridia bacterium]|nr:tRNA pseudouridine(38-40) synthase TruA [Clostridia bacterium]
MMNYLITLKYDGSGFHGWQRQENAITVQECVEAAAEKLFGEKISVTGCSRTDTGVHANCFKCNFRTEKIFSLEKIVTGMNFYLPVSVAVTDAESVREDFNARFDCKKKEYIYKIYNGRVRDPFSINKAYFHKYPLDAELMNTEAKDFIGTYDFSAFCAAGATTKTNVRTVFDAGVERQGDFVIFRVEGDGFLYNMVRIMAGTLIYIAEGKIEKGTVPQIIASMDRLKAGKTAAPEGLYLNKVYY